MAYATKQELLDALERNDFYEESENLWMSRECLDYMWSGCSEEDNEKLEGNPAPYFAPHQYEDGWDLITIPVLDYGTGPYVRVRTDQIDGWQ